jgi:pimeloyl-ACP methyl ester carboxylesterase
MEGLLLLGVLAGLGLCASVLGVGLYLSSPSLAAIGKPPAALPGAEVVEIPSASGALLRGWWVPADRRGGGGVVLMHGVWENRLRMVRRAEELHAHGFSVLLFDFQAHGESRGRHITYGHLEAFDAAAAVAFIRNKLPEERIGAVGVSLGGAAALLGPTPLDVDALVLESVYPDIDAALANRLRTGLGPLAGPIFVPLLTPTFKLLLPPILGVAADELRPIDRIGRVRAALLVASGTADDHTTIIEAQALFARAPQPKRFWAVQGAAHVDLERYDPPAYWHEVLPFLTDTLRQGGPER